MNKFLILYSVVNTPIFDCERGTQDEVFQYQALYKTISEARRYIQVCGKENMAEAKLIRRGVPKKVLKKLIESDKPAVNVPIAIFKSENIQSKIRKTKDCWYSITMYKMAI